MFSGISRERNISYHGASQTLSREQALEKARQEREARAQARLEKNATICIQSAITNYIGLTRRRRILRQEFDSKRKDIDALLVLLHANGKQFNIPTAALVELLRTSCLAFQSNNKQDWQRIFWCVDMCTKHLKQAVSTDNLLHDQSDIYVRLLPLLIRCAFSSLVSMISKTENEDIIISLQKISLLLGALRTDNGNLKLFEMWAAILRTTALRNFITSAVSEIINLNSDLKNSLHMTIAAIADIAHCALQMIVMYHDCKQHSLASKVVCTYVRDILFAESVISNQHNDTFLTSSWQNWTIWGHSLWRAAAEEVYRILFKAPSTDNDYMRSYTVLYSVYILKHFLKLVSNLSMDVVNKTSRSVMSVLQLISSIVKGLPWRQMSSLDIEDEKNMDTLSDDYSMTSENVEDESDMLAVDKHLAGFNLSHAIKIARTRTYNMSSVCDIHSNRHETKQVQDIMKSLQEHFAGGVFGLWLSTIILCDNPELKLPAIDAFLSVHDALLARTELEEFSTTFKSGSRESITSNLWRLPNTLAAQFLKNTFLRERNVADNLQMLWKYAINLYEKISLGNIEKSNTDTRHDTYASYQVLLLCLHSMNQQLFGLSDNEILEEKLLPLNSLRDVIRFLNRLLHKQIWSDVALSMMSLADHDLIHLLVVQQAIEAYHRLYDRHVRQRDKITHDEDWLWSNFETGYVNVDNIIDSMSDDQADEYATSSGGSNESRTQAFKLVLEYIPMVLPFKQRAQIFTAMLAKAKRTRNPIMNKIKLDIRRSNLVGDAMHGFRQAVKEGSSGRLRAAMYIVFYDEQGNPEPGIDGGGLFKELIDNATREAFHPDHGFFHVSPDQTLYPNPNAPIDANAFDTASILDHFEFFGQLLGKAVYEGILVEPSLADFFLNKLLGKSNSMDDLQSFDSELYQNLVRLKQLSDEELRALDLTFETVTTVNGEQRQIPLVKDGDKLQVNGNNVTAYVIYLAHFKLNVQIAAYTKAFLSGFQQVIPSFWLRMFSSHELQMIVGGASKRIDFDDLRKNVVYSYGYHAKLDYIQWFFEILMDMSNEDLAAFLMFTTGCSRPPLLGFGYLDPKLCIQRVDDSQRLPTASTCMNLLKLPQYASKDILRTKLLYAIHTGTGFELS